MHFFAENYLQWINIRCIQEYRDMWFSWNTVSYVHSWHVSTKSTALSTLILRSRTWTSLRHCLEAGHADFSANTPHTNIGSMWWRYFLWCHCSNDLIWLPGRQYISEIELRSIGNTVVSTYCLRVFKDPDPYIFHGICTGMFSRRPFVRLCYVFMVTFVLEDTIANSEKSRYTRWRFLPACQVKKNNITMFAPMHIFLLI